MGKKSKFNILTMGKNRYQYFLTQVAINKVILSPALFIKQKNQQKNRL